MSISVKKEPDGEYLRKLAKRLKNAKARVGFPKGKADSDVLDKAVTNEFGNERVPERSFMRTSFNENTSKYKGLGRKLAKKVVNLEADVEDGIGLIGEEGRADIQDKITSVSTPPNAESTIAKKGSSNPLIDTGDMRSSVTVVIESD